MNTSTTHQMKHPTITMVIRFTLALFLTISGAGMLFLALSGGLRDVDQMTGSGGDFIRAVIKTGYLWQFVGLVKFASGILILIPKTTKLGVIVSFPYAINIGLWTILYANEFVALGLVVMLMSMYLIYAYFDYYKSIVS